MNYLICATGCVACSLFVRVSLVKKTSTLLAILVTGYDKAGRKRIYFWPQNHMPDKFWASTAEYAPDVTIDDIRFLQQRIRNCSHDRLLPYLSTAALGKHYRFIYFL